MKPNSYDYFANFVARVVVPNDREFEMGTIDHEFADLEVLTDRLEKFWRPHLVALFEHAKALCWKVVVPFLEEAGWLVSAATALE